MAIAFSSAVGTDPNTAATTTTQSITVGTGDCIVAIAFTNFASFSGFSDGTNTYTLIETASSSAGPGNQKLYAYLASNMVAGTYTLTGTWGSSQSIRPVAAVQITGAAASPLDGHTHNDQTSPGTGAGGVVTGTASNLNSNALCLAITCPIFSNSAPAVVSPYTQTGAGTLWGVSTGGLKIGYNVVSSANSQQGTFTAAAGTTEHLSILLILDAPVPSAPTQILYRNRPVFVDESLVLIS